MAGIFAFRQPARNRSEFLCFRAFSERLDIAIYRIRHIPSARKGFEGLPPDQLPAIHFVQTRAK
jgi:hypothetical protein